MAGWLVAAVVVVVLVVLAWRPVRAWGRLVQLERARELFTLQRERLEAKFFDVASRSGKPRGLRWKDIDWEHEVAFARDRATGLILALAAVTIQFEAVEGGDMEGLAAVSNLRNASAVFVFQYGQWLTTGRTIFNLNPAEAIARLGQQYERVASSGPNLP